MIAFWVFGGLFVLGHLILISVLSMKPHAEGNCFRWELAS